MAVITCLTSGCPSQGRPVNLDLTYPDQDTGETRTVDEVMCGACGQRIVNWGTP